MSLDSQVYLDAVFFPRALNDPRVLAQEGWHYEIEKKDDPLTFKGTRQGIWMGYGDKGNRFRKLKLKTVYVLKISLYILYMYMVMVCTKNY